MEEKYDQINSSERIKQEKGRELEKYDVLKEVDIKSESSIFEVIKVKEYSEIIINIMKSIENYNQDQETIDDYPYFRGKLLILIFSSKYV